MSRAKYPPQQTDPPRSPRETLPTMYDLPSEDPKEPGLPDEFHDLQPQLLSATFRPQDYAPDQVFTASDLNLYYDVRHPLWYKRPDWFGVVGVPRLYDNNDLRLSYVIWQEGVRPTLIVELLSPGTADEDLGLSDSEALLRSADRQVHEPPIKWEVYERILAVPYYVVFDRYTDQLRAFTLVSGFYQELTLEQPKIWIPPLGIGLGLWQGEYQEIDRQWLRWYDAKGNWIPTDREEKILAQQQAEAERQRAEKAEARAAALAQRLRELGINPDELG